MTDPENHVSEQDERRKYPRVSSKFAVEVMPSMSPSAESENLSQNGLLFRHNGALQAGTIVLLTLRMPGSTGSVTVNARVIRSTPIGKAGSHRVAVNFMGTDAATEKRIRDFLEKKN